VYVEEKPHAVIESYRIPSEVYVNEPAEFEIRATLQKGAAILAVGLTYVSGPAPSITVTDSEGRTHTLIPGQCISWETSGTVPAGTPLVVRGTIKFPAPGSYTLKIHAGYREL